jgi:hypothetical protein
MSATPAHPPVPTLRLVSADDSPARRTVQASALASSGGAIAARVPTARERAEQKIIQENASAVSLSALDPRWVLAVQVMRGLQGGRAAILTPEERKRLMLVGNRMGLRSFDTNLVIAIVQDGARAGEDPLGTAAVGRLRLVGRETELADAKPGPSWALVAAMVLAAGVFGAAAMLVAIRMMG